MIKITSDIPKERIVSLIKKRLSGGLKEVSIDVEGNIKCVYKDFVNYSLSRHTLKIMIDKGYGYRIDTFLHMDLFHIMLIPSGKPLPKSKFDRR